MKGLINELAAMPSMHVGWALWCAASIVLVCKTPWRHVAWLYPIGTTLVVVATANHYWLDAAAAGGLVAIAMAIFPRYCADGTDRSMPDEAAFRALA